MFVFNIVGTEDHPAYQELMIANLDRQYDFLRSIVLASVALNRPMLSLEVVKALNFHAITCLHSHAGKWRPCKVTVGDYTPPPFHVVPSLMQMFVDEVNHHFIHADAVHLATWVLWKLNHIHPFVNGNGRTARVVAYLIVCLKAGGWLEGDVLLPELIRANRDEYVAALKAVDASLKAGALDLAPLHSLVSRLLAEQLATATPPAAPA